MADPVDSGFSMLVTAISLLVTALLVLLLLSHAFKSNGGTKLADQPGVGLADDVQAQTVAADGTDHRRSAAAAAAGGYGGLDRRRTRRVRPVAHLRGRALDQLPTTVSVATSPADRVAIGGDGSQPDTGGTAADAGRLVVERQVLADLEGRRRHLVRRADRIRLVVRRHGPRLRAHRGRTPSSSAIGWRQGAFPSSA